MRQSIREAVGPQGARFLGLSEIERRYWYRVATRRGRKLMRKRGTQKWRQDEMAFLGGVLIAVTCPE